MLTVPQKYLSDLLHLFYPHNCEGCGSDIVYDTQFLCSRCMHRLPATGFFSQQGNPTEKLFYGRLPVSSAAAAFYFTKDSLLQHLLVQLKYRNNKEAGYFLGRMMGYVLCASTRFSGVDVLVPLPLNPKKEFIRGYNQAALICEGIQEIWKKPVLSNAITRTRFTETQTKQNRIARWQNMEGVFEVTHPGQLQGKQVLLVDDVITTGATLEACGMAILAVPGCTLGIAAAAYTI
ncbi:MAG: phosphoribosyltransferase family protein [Bacteroidota bacterium]